MVFTYKECIERWGSDYMIKKAVSEGKLFQRKKECIQIRHFAQNLSW